MVNISLTTGFQVVKRANLIFCVLIRMSFALRPPNLPWRKWFDHYRRPRISYLAVVLGHTTTMFFFVFFRPIMWFHVPIFWWWWWWWSSSSSSSSWSCPPTIEHFPVPNFFTAGGASAALRDPGALCHPQPFRLPPCHPGTGESPAADARALRLGWVGTAPTAAWMGGGASGLQLLGPWEVWGWIQNHSCHSSQ